MSRFPLYGVQGKFTYRLLAMALFGQAIILSFFALVARGIALADGHPAEARRLLWVGLGLAVLALVACGLMRRPYGITVGWVVQALTWASALLVPAMVGVAAGLHGAVGAAAPAGPLRRPARRPARGRCAGPGRGRSHPGR